jgi:hypothetical protein
MIVEYTTDDRYLALKENGEAVVLVHDSRLVWTPPHSTNMRRWLNQKNRSMSILNKAEYGTYHAICDLEQIHIIEFTEWATKHDSNSDMACEEQDSRNPIRKLWKSIQNIR